LDHLHLLSSTSDQSTVFSVGVVFMNRSFF
jgi:hypothetical protein